MLPACSALLGISPKKKRINYEVPVNGNCYGIYPVMQEAL